jgi:acetoacetyl-CoA reductase
MKAMGNQAEVVQRPEAWRDESAPVVSRIAFVSGGMGGIGTAICRRLGRAGHTVVAGCLPGYEKKAEWLDGMRAEGYRVHAAEGDVARFESCAEMFYNIASVVGPVDVLVNNAGITRDSMFHRMTPEHWGAVINTNLNSLFNMCRPVIEGMRERNFGRIINISSINGQKGQMGQVNYSAAKAGELGFTKALAQENARKGITVNAICPGYIATEMVMAVPKDVLEKNIIPQIPAGRLGQPEEVARCVLFLASDQAGFITGATLTANGGQYMI